MFIEVFLLMWESLMIPALLGQKVWDQTSLGLKTCRSKTRDVGQFLDMTKNSKLNRKTNFGIRLRHVIADVEKGFEGIRVRYGGIRVRCATPAATVVNRTRPGTRLGYRCA